MSLIMSKVSTWKFDKRDIDEICCDREYVVICVTVIVCFHENVLILEIMGPRKKISAFHFDVIHLFNRTD